MKNCTLLVLSCDKYEDAWIPFFTLLKKHWASFDMPVVLNTETKSFSFDGLDIRTFSMYEKDQQVPWGQRMLDHLAKVDTDFVYLMCEDFFIRENVKTDKMQSIIDIMEADQKISSISTHWAPIETVDESKYADFALRPQNGSYKFYCGGVWRVSHLKQYILPHESPWEWEVNGNYRSAYTSNKFYILKQNIENYINIGWTCNWMGIRKGKWVIEDVKPLFEQHNIEVDYNNLGITHQDVGKMEAYVTPTLRRKLSLLTKKLPPRSWMKKSKERKKYKLAKQQIENIFGNDKSVYDL